MKHSFKARLLSYLPIYPARIVLRRVTRPGQEGDSTEWVRRYGIMPDGSEHSLGSTTNTERLEAEKVYRHMLGGAGIQFVSPIRSDGTDFFPLEQLAEGLVHLPWVTLRNTRKAGDAMLSPSDFADRAVIWDEWLNMKNTPSGSLVSPRLPRSSMK